MDWLDLLQWPAMAVTIAASWLVASDQKGRRNAGFWVFLLSNVLWVAWGWHAGAPTRPLACVIGGVLRVHAAPASRAGPGWG